MILGSLEISVTFGYLSRKSIFQLQELGKYRGILATASNADKMVKTKFEQNREGIELLSRYGNGSLVSIDLEGLTRCM